MQDVFPIVVHIWECFKVFALTQTLAKTKVESKLNIKKSNSRTASKKKKIEFNIFYIHGLFWINKESMRRELFIQI